MKKFKQSKDSCFFAKDCILEDCRNCMYYSENPKVPDWLISAIKKKVQGGINVNECKRIRHT